MIEGSIPQSSGQSAAQESGGPVKPTTSRLEQVVKTGAIGKQETPKQQQAREDQEDMTDLEMGASILAAMQRGKGDLAKARQWEEVAKTAGQRAGKQEQGPKKIVISNFSSEDGHRLTPAEQLSDIQKQLPGEMVPSFSSEDGHRLTVEEQIDYFRKRHS